MNLDNQLILGIVFITAGIALALLAYAAFLNRRGSDEGEPEEAEVAGGAFEADQDDQLDAETLADEPAEAAEPAGDRAAEPTVPAVAFAADTVRSDRIEAPPPEPTVEAAYPEPKSESALGEPAEARLMRDPQTQRLLIEVEDHRYRTMDDLRRSDDWDSVSSLFSDLLAWMVQGEPAGEGADVPAPREGPEVPKAGKSMIEQINDILSERLADQEGELSGVRLMAGADGTIRVFVGLKSYSMDDVPDPEVQAIIRQAVAEWESRQ